MSKLDISFEEQFNIIVHPIIDNLGGKRLILKKGWMQPHFIYKFPNNVWFDCSYDWRDRYFQADLGRLFLFRDVMPRAVVLEDYDYYLIAAYKEKILISSDTIQRANCLDVALKIVADTLPSVIKNYQNLSLIAMDQIQKRENKLKDYLIKELHEEDFTIENEHFIL